MSTHSQRAETYASEVDARGRQLLEHAAETRPGRVQFEREIPVERGIAVVALAVGAVIVVAGNDQNFVETSFLELLEDHLDLAITS